MDYSRTSQERAILKARNNAVERHCLYFNREAIFKGKAKKNDTNCSTCKENKKIERSSGFRSLRHYCS